MFLQNPVRRGDDAHAHLAHHGRSHALYLAVLQDPQQLALRLQRHIADLVQEYRAAIGILKKPDLVVRGARERSLHVAEQLALEQRLDHRRAIDGGETARGGWAQPMQRAGDQFLPGSRRACHQGRPEMRGYTPDPREDASIRGLLPTMPSN